MEVKTDKATEKQIRYVNRIIDYLGEEKVEEYIHKFYKTADINNLTKVQAQKIITGLDAKLPKKPIRGVYGTFM